VTDRSGYERRAQRLIDVLGQLGRSLVDDAPTARSLEINRQASAVFLEVEQHLRAAWAAHATRAELADIAWDAQLPLTMVGAATSKGNIPIARPDLLDEASDLLTVFRERRYADLP
jgi:hypothetical protein